MHARGCAAPRGWRNERAHELGARYYRNVPILPLGNVTHAFWDAHFSSIALSDEAPQKPDCTHFCYAPALAEGLAFVLSEVLRTGIARTEAARSAHGQDQDQRGWTSRREAQMLARVRAALVAANHPVP